MIRNFIRMVLWVALIGTTATFLMLAALLPSEGLVAGLIEAVVVFLLLVAGIALWAWGDAEETEKYRLEKLAAEARLRAAADLEALLERLAASRS